jgi:hypothetical protein
MTSPGVGHDTGSRPSWMTSSEGGHSSGTGGHICWLLRAVARKREGLQGRVMTQNDGGGVGYAMNGVRSRAHAHMRNRMENMFVSRQRLDVFVSNLVSRTGGPREAPNA